MTTLYLGAAESDNGPTDTAHLDSSLDSDEALLSPAGAPGVLDEPVVHSVLSPVADHHHSVVRLGIAGATGENASLAVSSPAEIRDDIISTETKVG